MSKKAQSTVMDAEFRVVSETPSDHTWNGKPVVDVTARPLSARVAQRRESRRQPRATATGRGELARTVECRVCHRQGEPAEVTLGPFMLPNICTRCAALGQTVLQLLK